MFHGTWSSTGTITISSVTATWSSSGTWSSTRLWWRLWLRLLAGEGPLEPGDLGRGEQCPGSTKKVPRRFPTVSLLQRHRGDGPPSQQLCCLEKKLAGNIARFCKRIRFEAKVIWNGCPPTLMAVFGPGINPDKTSGLEKKAWPIQNVSLREGKFQYLSYSISLPQTVWSAWFPFSSLLGYVIVWRRVVHQ